jgi:hypothetical protein
MRLFACCCFVQDNYIKTIILAENSEIRRTMSDFQSCLNESTG